MSEKFIDLSGNLRITVEIAGETFLIERSNATVSGFISEEHLPDKPSGYTVHLLRKEEKIVLNIITKDNEDLIGKKDSEDIQIIPPEEVILEIDPDAETKEIPPIDFFDYL